MSISPLSHAGQVYMPQQTHQTTADKSAGTQSSDSVQLSPAAIAKLKGGDADGDGDGQ